MAVSVSVALKTLFIVLTGIMAAMLIYLFYMDRYYSCLNPYNWWVQVAMYHVIMDMIFVVAWFYYKESSWIKTIVFANFMFWVGSFGTCAYVVFQLFMLSKEEASKDPIYFVLARRQKGNNVMGHTNRHFLTIAKVIVAAIGCYTLGVIIYAFVVDGSPLNAEELTPCMITSLVDTHVHFVVFSVWIAYKESSWTSAVVWIILHLCFASVTVSVYIIRQLFSLSPQQPIYLILFNQRSSYWIAILYRIKSNQAFYLFICMYSPVHRHDGQ